MEETLTSVARLDGCYGAGEYADFGVKCLRAPRKESQFSSQARTFSWMTRYGRQHEPTHANRHCSRTL
jgi:hypothetical protein